MIMMTNKQTELVNAPQHERYPYGIFAVGDQVHVKEWSDVHPGTVVEVSRSGKMVKVRMDSASLAEGEMPEVIPGGFVGHCTNQHDLKYDIVENLNGHIRTFSLRKWRGRYVWTERGMNPDGKMAIASGWRRFHDYNF